MELQSQIPHGQDPSDFVITKISKLSPLTKCPSIVVRILSRQINSRHKAESSSQADNQQQNTVTKPGLHYGSQSSCTLELVDDSEEVIQLFLYGDEQIENFGKQFVEQHVFHLFNFSVKAYSNDLFPKQHFKLSFNKSSFILEIDTENEIGAPFANLIPRFFLSYQSFAEILKENTPTLQAQAIDTAGVVIYVNYSEIDIAKGGGGKLYLILQDADNQQIPVTLWSNHALLFQKTKKYQILLLRNMRAALYQFKIQLSSLPCTQIFSEPDCEISPYYMSLVPIRDSIIKRLEEKDKAEQLFDKSKPAQYASNIPLNAAFSNGNPTIAKINYNSAYQNGNMPKPSANLGEVEKKAKEYLFSGQLLEMSSFAKAIFRSLSSRIHYYYSCPLCKKRLENASVVQCTSCMKEIIPLPKLILSIIIADETNQILCTCFSGEAEQLLGLPAAEVIQIVQNIEITTTDPSQITQNIKDAFSSQYESCFIFKILSRLEDFNGQRKVSHKIQKLNKEERDVPFQSSAVSGDQEEDYSSQPTDKPENNYPLSQQNNRIPEEL